MIDGNTSVLAHIGYPTHSFKSPSIYNPWFESVGVNTVVVPMACRAEHYEKFLNAVFTLDNVAGALITMPHKVATTSLLDTVSTAVKIAGACNAVRRCDDGKLQGELFDGEGFVRGALRKGCVLEGARALVVGSGGVGSAIAAYRVASHAFVGEVVMREELTTFLSAVAARGCRFQVGTDMLFEQIPAYLEYFGLPTATPDQLRATARLG